MDKKICSFLLWCGGIMFALSAGIWPIVIVSLTMCLFGVMMLYGIKEEEIDEKERAEIIKQIESEIDLENQEWLLLLDEMCDDENFDTEKAKEIIEKADLSKYYLWKHDYSRHTILETAVKTLNIKMVELLLESGADPNSCDYEGRSIFFDLWYLDYYSEEVSAKKLEIAKIMLDHGADPSGEVNNSYTDKFDYIVHELYCSRYESIEIEFKHHCDFFTLLVIYGGKSDERTPQIVKEFDKDNFRRYHFEFEEYPDKNLLGTVKDENGRIYAYIK